MASKKYKAAQFAGLILNIVPRFIRYRVIQAMIAPELNLSPPESVRWLLGVHNFVEGLVNIQCTRWGDGVHIKHQLMDGIHSYFYERIPAEAHVLDVGCGIGAVAYSIATQAQATVIGIDNNQKNIDFARQRFEHPNLTFELGDVTQYLPPAGKVDVVVLSSILEHLDTRIELLQTLIERFQPILFLIRVPTFERHHFVALKQELGLFPYTDHTHVLEYSPEVFATEMNQAGLDIRSMEIRWGDIWAECVVRRTVSERGK